MRILVTGGAGAIGSTFGHYAIFKGYKAFPLDNLNNGYVENLTQNGVKYINFFEETVLNTEALIKIIRDFEIDSIVHLAAITSLPECEENPTKCYENNTLGTLSVLEAVKITSVKTVVFASTSAVYENNQPNSWSKAYLENDDKILPTLTYPLSKKLAEDICFSYAKKFGIRIPILRFFNVFGPRQDIYRKSPPLINYITREIINNRIPILHSDGNQSRDYIHIEDVCKSIEAALNKGRSQIYNVCSEQLLSVNEIYETIAKTLNFNQPPKYNKAEDLWKDYNLKIDKSLVEKETNKFCLGSNYKIKKELGIKFNENLKDLISETALEISKIYAPK